MMFPSIPVASATIEHPYDYGKYLLTDISASRFQYEEPRSAHSSGHRGAALGVYGRDRETAWDDADTDRRYGGPFARVCWRTHDDVAESGGEGDQGRFVDVVKSGVFRASWVRLAGRIRCVFGIEVGSLRRGRLHQNSAGASCEVFVRGRVSVVVAFT